MRRSRAFLLFIMAVAVPHAAVAQDPDANINSRYLIERADVRGLSARDRLPFDDDLRALVGRRLDSDDVHRLEARLRAELPEHVIRRRTVRGSEPGHIRLIFEAHKADWARWLRFEAQDANLLYHSDQGWGARIPLSISGGDVLVSPVFVIDAGDDLIEEYGGFGLRVESRRLGSERLGFLFDWSSFEQTWRDATVGALATNPEIPALYSNRRAVASVLKFAITRQISVEGGVRIAELDSLDDTGESRMANAALFAVNFSQRPREPKGSGTSIDAALTVRAGTDALESDLVYERYAASGTYAQRRGRHLVAVSGTAGATSGDAPLFERFSLGDSRTLRGWNKYDIAPLGGSRVAHGSLEYRYRGFGMFVDAGSVWDDSAARNWRVSTGLTFNPGPFFLTVGFPVNTDEFRAAFTMGLRFSSAGLAKY